MYLSELELHGFKSFAQKTRVKFDNGLTAIVGPNGCGKSNIVDALRWSLGEQRPSLLRSSAMTNVIFNGTASKKALGMAEVSLTIQNNKGILPSEYTDITITRRLYRSGDSEYLLNKAPCRLKDIIDLFMDTGMGANAYSVIELKMVEEILNDKNNDRRKLFEEAAGITRYKERKKQTLRKLDETRSDMNRVEDILFEIRKKTRSLQIQASKAERAKKYERDIRHLELAVAWHEYTYIRQELEPLKERIVNATTARDELARKLDELEQSEDRARQTLIRAEREDNEARKSAGFINTRIRDAETSLEIISEKIKNEEGVIRQFEHDIVQSETDIRDLKKSRKEAGQKLEQEEKALESTAGELTRSEEEFRHLDEEVVASRRELEEANAEYEATGTAMNDLQARRIRLESKLEGGDEDGDRIEREIRTIEQNIEEFRTGLPDFESKLNHAASELENAEASLSKSRQERDELVNRQNVLKDELRSLTSRHDALQSEMNLLQSIADSNEAFPSSIRYLKDQKSRVPEFKVVSDIFSTSDEYAVALESVLGEACNYLVVKSQGDARQLVDLLKKEKQGKVTVIPVDLLDQSESHRQRNGGYTVHRDSLCHKVECDDQFGNLKKLFLGTVRVFDSLDEALKNRDHASTAVSLQGDVVSPEGFLNSGSTHNNTGVRVGLKDKLRSLEKKSVETERKMDQTETELHRISRRYQEIDIASFEKSVREATSLLQRLNSEKNTLEAQQKIYEKNLADLTERRENLSASRSSIAFELRQLQPEFDNLEKKQEKAVRRQVNLKSELQKKEDSRQRAQTFYNEIKLKHRDCVNRVANIKNDIRRSAEGIEEVKKRLDQRAENAKNSKDKILAYRREVEETRTRLTDLEKEKAVADKKVQETGETCSRQRGKINLLEESLKETRRKKETNQDLLHSLELTRSKYESDAKNIADSVWEDYGIMADQIEERLPEDTDVATARETLFTVKERLKNLGQVNPLAIEEYEEEKQRLEHHEEQIADLVEAEEKLKKTIEEINETALERFSVTFTEIRNNFKEVFKALFEEDDECDLVIKENQDDILESRINIFAQPRGKRPSTIEQLSGGEKTLTAIALLFAIYLVKPSPFCILDEVDAPLDDANIERFTRLINRFSKDTQFIVITHNKKTMEKAEVMYGVTMPEKGISKLVGVRLEDVAA